MEGLNVLSLFDGMSCGMIALDRKGVKVKNYYASEVDKHAIKVCQYNWPNTVQLGSVLNWRDWEIDWNSIDLLLAGSPCQGFSFAGKQLAFDDPRSKLYFEFESILLEKKPKNFLLENVKMAKKNSQVISDRLGVDCVAINSNILSAQNRQRLYWTNLSISEAQDKGITLEHIIDHSVVTTPVGNWQRYVPDNLPVYVDPYNRKAICGGKSTSLRTNVHNGNMWVKMDSGGYRNLTRRECELLQTVPLDYTKSVSETQAKKMLGNGWTVDVIAHIFEGLK